MLRWLIGIILGEIICDSSNWKPIQRLKITILGANWQLFRLERNAKFSYFILSTQNIKFYWFVMKIKKFLLPIWWYNRGLFPLRNNYFGVFVLNGLNRGGGHFMKLVITDNLSFTDYYHGNSQWQCFIANQNQECHFTCQWMTNCQWWQVSWNTPEVATIIKSR